MPNMVCAEYGAEYGAPNHPRPLPVALIQEAGRTLRPSGERWSLT